MACHAIAWPPGQLYKGSTFGKECQGAYSLMASIPARGLAHPLPDGLQRLRGQRRPVPFLPDDAQRLARPVGPGRVARKLPVGYVGVVLDGSQRLHHIHPRRAIPRRQLRSQRRALLAGRQVDEIRQLEACPGVSKSPGRRSARVPW